MAQQHVVRVCAIVAVAAVCFAMVGVIVVGCDVAITILIFDGDICCCCWPPLAVLGRTRVANVGGFCGFGVVLLATVVGDDSAADVFVGVACMSVGVGLVGGDVVAVVVVVAWVGGRGCCT